MKILLTGLSIGVLLISSTAFANDKGTSMHSNWICTTNASSSDKAGDKEADKKMSSHGTSGKNAFMFASKHCRDCTKITCEAK